MLAFDGYLQAESIILARPFKFLTPSYATSSIDVHITQARQQLAILSTSCCSASLLKNLLKLPFKISSQRIKRDFKFWDSKAFQKSFSHYLNRLINRFKICLIIALLMVSQQVQLQTRFNFYGISIEGWPEIFCGNLKAFEMFWKTETENNSKEIQLIIHHLACLFLEEA